MGLMGSASRSSQSISGSGFEGIWVAGSQEFDCLGFSGSGLCGLELLRSAFEGLGFKV